MSRLAYLLARHLWGWMLWFMRRAGMKRLQRRSMRMLPMAMRPRAHRSMVRQNAFARRHGLGLLTFSINLVLASVAISLCYQAALWLLDSGTLSVPESVRQKIESSPNSALDREP